MSEAFVKFKEIVDRSRTFAVCAGETSDISKILIAATLNSALNKLGKTSNLNAGSVYDSIKKFVSIILREEFAATPHRKENIIIKFDSKDLPAKELKYEKDGDFIKIVLEGEGSGLDISKIQIEKEFVPIDLLLLIDPQEKEIDGILSATPYKDVIKIGARDKSLAIKITEIIKVLFGKIDENFKEALWFLLEEERKVGSALSKEHLVILKDIADLGIDQDILSAAQAEIYKEPFHKLLGRAFVRSHYEKDISTLWSFLPKSDFQKTGNDRVGLLNILQGLRGFNPQSTFYALLWNGEDGVVSAYIASANTQKLGMLASRFSTSPASSYFSIECFDSFSGAEMKIRSFIKQII